MKQYLTFVDISKNRREILKVQKESVVVRLRAPSAILIAESANCMQSRACFAIPLGVLTLKLNKLDAVEDELFRFWLRIHGDILNRKTTPRLAESGSRQDCLLPIDTIFFKPFNKSMVIVHYIPGVFLAKLIF
jgi:hypothetical protein